MKLIAAAWFLFSSYRSYIRVTQYELFSLPCIVTMPYSLFIYYLVAFHVN